MGETTIDLWNPWERKWGTITLTDAERILDDLALRVPEARRKERARLTNDIALLHRKLDDVRDG
ncbi:hypothetical protein [Gemmobacter sp. 24YEA27]|uniref:hypothetical protein n=1 Tax=Gemmobacter sp. 24YEA27 TaxID=3040672 RepID=UPI0024B3358D|nr:hypothetical protein [Gemmobacter sp. 24YEA27]